MRPIEQLYRDFSARMAKTLEEEANFYSQHPDLQDADHQFIDVLREQCRQWKKQIQRLDAAGQRRAS